MQVWSLSGLGSMELTLIPIIADTSDNSAKSDWTGSDKSNALLVEDMYLPSD